MEKGHPSNRSRKATRNDKNALTGFAYRNRDQFPMKNPAASLRKQRGTDRPVKAPQSAIRHIRAITVSAPRVKFVRPVISDASEPKLKYLYEMERTDCRWPISGDRSTTLFCGNEQLQGKPYCPCHHRLSVGRGTESERTATKISRRNLE